MLIIGTKMKDHRAHRYEQAGSGPTQNTEIPFATLLYRFLFFDWLFVDMTLAANLFERHAAWQHNRGMRIYLPLYLRRWSVLTALDVGIGGILEKLMGSNLLAAWFFTGACITATGMMVIAVLWIFLSNPKLR